MGRSSSKLWRYGSAIASLELDAFRGERGHAAAYNSSYLVCQHEKSIEVTFQGCVPVEGVHLDHLTEGFEMRFVVQMVPSKMKVDVNGHSRSPSKHRPLRKMQLPSGAQTSSNVKLSARHLLPSNGSFPNIMERKSKQQQSLACQSI